jgi:F0F1-type ATP synthase assembly protein I
MRQRKPEFSALRASGLLMGLGFTLVLATLAGYGLGYLVDIWLGIDVLKYLGLLVGAAAGLVSVVRLVRSVSDETNRKH